MSTLQDQIGNIWIEELAPAIRTSLNEIDSTFKTIRSSTENVTSENMGKDWKTIHTFITSVAGRIRATDMTADGISGAANDSVIRVAGTSLKTYPGLVGYPMTGTVRRTIGLQKWKGNVFMPFYFMRADKLDSVLTSEVALNLKQTAANYAQTMANLFFTTDPTYRSYVTVGAITGTGNTYDGDGGTSAIGVKFTISSTDRIAFLQPGMEVYLYQSGGTTLCNDATSKPCVVRSVDYLNGEVIVAHSDGSSTFDNAVGVGTYVTLADSAGYGPKGPEYWLVDSGSDVYGLNLATYPQFKSYVQSSIGSALTDEILRTYLGAFMDAYPGKEPDTLLTTSGVLRAYVGEVDSLLQYGVQGQPVRRAGGYEVSDIPWDYDGRKLKWQTSRMVGKGRLYGMRLANNIKRYVPPRLPGAASNGYFNNELEFIAPLGGLNGIWMPVTSSDAVTEWVQAPFEMCEEYAPEIMQGVKLSGLTEA